MLWKRQKCIRCSPWNWRAYSLAQWFLPGGDFVSRDIWRFRETFWFSQFGGGNRCQRAGRVWLLASSTQRPGMLLHILQYTEQSPQQGIIQFKIPVVAWLRKPTQRNINDHLRWYLIKRQWAGQISCALGAQRKVNWEWMAMEAVFRPKVGKVSMRIEQMGEAGTIRIGEH